MIDLKGHLHASDCRLSTMEPCWDDECDYCTTCSCGAECDDCGSFFWFRAHPDENVRRDGQTWTASDMDHPLLCRWCWMRTRMGK